MSQMNIDGRIVYLPGPWGLSIPVPNANIKLFDRDIPGKGDDLILQTSTDETGRFSGQTAEWRDRLGPLPDPGDLPMFSVEVEDSYGRRFVSPPVPVATVFDKATLPPVVVPWPPGGAVVVDGVECWTPAALVGAVAAKAFGDRANFALEFDAATFPQFGALRGEAGGVGEWLRNHAPGQAEIMEAIEQERAKHVDPGALDPGTIGLILGVYALCIVGGTAMILATGVSTALILGLALGYDIDFGSDTDGSGAGTIGQKYRIKFTKPAK